MHISHTHYAVQYYIDVPSSRQPASSRGGGSWPCGRLRPSHVQNEQVGGMGNATTRALQMCGPSQHSPWPNSHSAGVKFQPTTQPSAMHILAHRKHGHHICIYLCAPWEDTFRNQRSLEHVTTCVIQTNRTTNDRQAKDDGTQTREIEMNGMRARAVAISVNEEEASKSRRLGAEESREEGRAGALQRSLL